MNKGQLVMSKARTGAAPRFLGALGALAPWWRHEARNLGIGGHQPEDRKAGLWSSVSV
jgi:hypothetical protein